MNLQPNPQTEPNRADWRALLSDLEARVDSLTAALQEVRLVVRRLCESSLTSQPGEDHGTATESPDPETLREEVRQAVAQARAQLEAGAIPSDVIPFAEKVTTPGPEGAPWAGESEDIQSAAPETDETTEVETSEIEAAKATPTEEPDFGAEALPEPESTEMADEREEVRRLVEQARAELMPELSNWNEPPTGEPGEPAQPGGESDGREAVRRAVAEARTELDVSTPSSSSWGREKMASEFQPPPGEHKDPPPSAWARSNEPPSPPILVIENEESRVELAQVYEMLNRLGIGSQAALLNHTPHSATLSMVSVTAPAPEVLTEVVKAVFGRDCEVTSDGARLSVRVGGSSGSKSPPWRMSA